MKAYAAQNRQGAMNAALRWCVQKQWRVNPTGALRNDGWTRLGHD